MIRTMLAATAVAALITGASLAQSFDDAIAANNIGGQGGASEIDIVLNAVVEEECRVSAYAGVDEARINLTGPLDTGATFGPVSFSPRCNFDNASVTVEFSSANAGALKNDGDLVPYVVEISGGGSGYDPLSGASLSSPVQITVPLQDAFGTQTRGLSFITQGPLQKAGTWTDTITATVLNG